MRTQVYCVAHNGKSGDFLLGSKNDKGYYFHTKGDGGIIYPNGKNLNGGGIYALPGGKLEGGDPTAEAMKEFFEETNVDVSKSTPSPLAKKWIYNPEWGYYGVYLDLNGSLESVATQAANHLVTGHEAATAVQDGRYGVGQYQALRAAFPGCPLDNELATVQIWNIESDWERIRQWQNNISLGWYYNVLLYYRKWWMNHEQ